MKHLMHCRSPVTGLIFALSFVCGIGPVNNVISENRGSLESRVSSEEKRALWYIHRLSNMHGGEERALRQCDKALEDFPDSLLIRMRKATLLMRLERDDEAIPILDNLIEQHPNVHGNYDLRAKTFLIVEGGTVEENPLLKWLRSTNEIKQHFAIIALRDAYSIRKDTDNVLADHERDRLDTALHEYREALRRNPEDKEAWVKICETLEQLGRIDLAVECVEQLIDRYPDHQAAYDVQALLLLHIVPRIASEHPLVLWSRSDDQPHRDAVEGVVRDAVARVRSKRKGSTSGK